MKIAFNYNLSFFVPLIVICVLVGVFVVLHADIEEDALVDQICSNMVIFGFAGIGKGIGCRSMPG